MRDQRALDWYETLEDYTQVEGQAAAATVGEANGEADQQKETKEQGRL